MVGLALELGWRSSSALTGASALSQPKDLAKQLDRKLGLWGAVSIAVGASTTPRRPCCAMRRPVDFRAPDRRLVDVCIVSLAAPGDRQTQLWLLEAMARMVLRTRLLERLRQVAEVGEVADVLRESQRESAG